MEKLTVSLTVGVAASVRPPKARLMAAAIWREREGTGEVESEQTVTKPRYGGTYERGGIRRRSSTRRRWGSRRWSTYYRGDGDWSSDERRKGQRGGLGSGLYRRAEAQEKGRERAGWSPAMRGRRRPHALHGRAIDGTRKGRRRTGKEKNASGKKGKGADGRGQKRSEGEGKSACGCLTERAGRE